MTRKLEKSSNQSTSVQQKIQKIKQEAKTYRIALENVTLGRIIISSNVVQPTLAFGPRDVPESCATCANEQMLDEVAAIDNIFKFMNIKDRKSTNVIRIGKLDPQSHSANSVLKHGKHLV